MSCGCKTSGDSAHSCGSSAGGCASVDTCGNSYKLSVFDWLAGIESPGNTAENDFVEVRFKNERKSFFKNVNRLPLHPGSIVTVEASPGHDIGTVSLTGELVKMQMKRKKFPEVQALKIYRIANQKDVEIWHEARAKEDYIKQQAKKVAEALGLDMKITDVEFQGDGTKATFYYTADSRVDFRQLIKELALAFRIKVDMKQIGFRQEAAKIGGIGSCGRELCCSSWLTDFRSVNTNAARYQQLSINPQKLAGQCGKLKCCLNYELDSYLDALRDFPSSNAKLDTEKGLAYCIKIDVFKRKMWFTYADNSFAWYDLDAPKVKALLAENKKGVKSPPLEDLASPQSLTPKSADLIQEDSVDRFEKKRSGKRSSKKDRKPAATKPQQNIRKDGESGERRPQNKGRKNLPKKPKPNGDAGA